MIKQTNTKLVVSGSTLEVYSYRDGPLFYNHTVSSSNKLRKRNTGTDAESIKRKAESNKRSMRRAGLELRKLVNANVWQYRTSSGIVCTPLFATFTFRDGIRDVVLANNLFLKFIHRLNYKVSGGLKKGYFKYVSVVGFQNKSREGVIHYHTIFFNLSPEQEPLLHEMWKEGTVNIKKVIDSENVGLYMSKHVAESAGDVRLFGHKRYFGSRDLFKAFEVKDQYKAQSIISLIPSDYIPTVDSYTGFQGKVKYSRYSLNKGELLVDIVPEIKLFL